MFIDDSAIVWYCDFFWSVNWYYEFWSNNCKHWNTLGQNLVNMENCRNSRFLQYSITLFVSPAKHCGTYRDHFVWRLCIRLSGSNTFYVVTHSYVSQTTHPFLGMLPVCLYMMFPVLSDEVSYKHILNISTRLLWFYIYANWIFCLLLYIWANWI